MKDDSLYLIHILECIDRIERTADGGDAFMDDTRRRMPSCAVCRRWPSRPSACLKSSPEVSQHRMAQHRGFSQRGRA